MRSSAALGLVLLVAAAACGGETRSAEGAVRAWSKALNAGDNEGAASLFAPGATVIQGGRTLVLGTHAEAVAWNASLPCAGKIVDLESEDGSATATFLLSDRGTTRCDGPGERATALFRVRDGRIVLWHQLERPSPDAEESV